MGAILLKMGHYKKIAHFCITDDGPDNSLFADVKLFFVSATLTTSKIATVCYVVQVLPPHRAIDQSPEPVLCEDKPNNTHFTDFKYLLCNVWRNHKHMHWKKKEINQHCRSPTCRGQTLSVEPGGSVFPGRPARQGRQVPPLLDHHHFYLHLHLLHNHRQYIW